jgi:gamma-glutamyl:cysteine ligase YbdK (ATP-grasp superfamily)
MPQLPKLLSTSANSPFVEGEDSGWRSIRSQRLLEMPTGGTPPVLSSWDDWAAASRRDNTRRHWDAWPRPEYGTLEVRVMDQPTDVRRSAGLAGTIQELVRAAAEREHPVYDRAVYTRERTEAAQAGAGPEAERQLAVAAAEGIAAVPRDVVARSVD